MSSYQKRNSDWQAYGQTYGAAGSRHWRRLQQLKRQSAQRRTGGKK